MQTLAIISLVIIITAMLYLLYDSGRKQDDEVEVVEDYTPRFVRGSTANSLEEPSSRRSSSPSSSDSSSSSCSSSSSSCD